MSVFDALQFRPDRAADENSPQADTRDAPTIGEIVGASRRVAEDEETATQTGRLFDAYRPLVKALLEQGVDERSLLFGGRPAPATGYGYDNGRVWREARRRGLVTGERADFERQALRRGTERDRDMETLSRGEGIGSTLAELTGGMIGGPQTMAINIATLPIGGAGERLWVKALTEGAANAGMTAALLPEQASARARLGEDFTLTDAATEVGMAGAFGAAMPVAGRGLKIADTAGYRALAPVRGAIDPLFRDQDLARALSQAEPAHLRTPEQQAALDVLTREAEIRQSSPFEPTAAGEAEHRARLQEATNKLDEAPRVSPRGFDMQRYMRRNRSAESSNSDTAAPTTSSAYGRYQFLKQTWLRFYRLVYGATGETNAQILAKRADGEVNERVMARFTQHNINRLRTAGLPIDDGTVYLMHFLGEGDGLRVLRAHPDADLRGLVQAGSRAANAKVFAKNHTAADLIAWARRKMGDTEGAGPPSERQGETPIDDALAGEEADIGAARARAEGELSDLETDGITPEPVEAPPRLRPDAFADEESWRAAQDREDGIAPEPAPAPKAKPPRPARRDDLLRFIARNGGISYDGLGPRERELGHLGHDLKNTGYLAHFVPGAGPLLRPTGKSLEEIGELLWEAGYFGPSELTPRPTDGELITRIDQIIRNKEKVYAEGGAAEPTRAEREEDERLWREAEPERRDARRMDELNERWGMQHVIGGTADELGLEAWPSDIDEIEALMRAGVDELLPPFEPHSGMSPDEARPYVLAWVNRKIDDVLDDGFLQTEEELYDVYAATSPRREGAALEDAGTGRAGEPGDAGPGEPFAGDGGGPYPEEPGGGGFDDPDSDASRLFDTDDGDGVKATAESDWHDIRADRQRVTVEPGTATPSTHEGWLAWEDAQDKIDEAVNKLGLKQGRELVAEPDEALLDELAQAVMNGEDAEKLVAKAIKDGRLKLDDKGAPELKDVKPLPPSDVVPAPAETIKSADYAGPLISQAEADERIGAWKAMARAIGEQSGPRDGQIILSLFDASGVWSQPYRDMGFEVHQLDIKHGADLLKDLPHLLEIIREFEEGGAKIVGVIAQPPCTTFAGSGARWWGERHNRKWSNAVRKMWGTWADKHFETPVEYNQALVAATETIIGSVKPEFFVIENPVGRIEHMTGLPKPLLAIQPHHFGAPYTKRTHLWGEFNPELDTANVLPTEGSRMHKLRSRDEKDEGLRSLTPEGFAYAFALANAPGVKDVPKLGGAEPAPAAKAVDALRQGDSRPREPVTQIVGEGIPDEKLTAQGAAARAAGWEERDNPYNAKSEAGQLWLKGFQEGEVAPAAAPEPTPRAQLDLGDQAPEPPAAPPAPEPQGALPMDIPEAPDLDLAARQRQAAQLQAEAGPLRALIEQDSTMGTPLFDAAGQPLMDLGDGRGPRSLADIDAEIQGEQAGIEAIKSCLL